MFISVSETSVRCYGITKCHKEMVAACWKEAIWWISGPSITCSLKRIKFGWVLSAQVWSVWWRTHGGHVGRRWKWDLCNIMRKNVLQPFPNRYISDQNISKQIWEGQNTSYFKTFTIRFCVDSSHPFLEAKKKQTCLRFARSWFRFNFDNILNIFCYEHVTNWVGLCLKLYIRNLKLSASPAQSIFKCPPQVQPLNRGPPRSIEGGIGGLL